MRYCVKWGGEGGKVVVEVGDGAVLSVLGLSRMKSGVPRGLTIAKIFHVFE